MSDKQLKSKYISSPSPLLLAGIRGMRLTPPKFDFRM
jgi:hypothetical protein